MSRPSGHLHCVGNRTHFVFHFSTKISTFRFNLLKSKVGILLQLHMNTLVLVHLHENLFHFSVNIKIHVGACEQLVVHQNNSLSLYFIKFTTGNCKSQTVVNNASLCVWFLRYEALRKPILLSDGQICMHFPRKHII